MGKHNGSNGNGHKHGNGFVFSGDNPALAADQWLKNAEQDLEVAKTLFLAGHYSWAAFACQQALEKLLKAGYVNSRHKIPPHVHKLERLTAIMKLDPPERHIDNILEVGQCYTSTRYPGYKSNLCVRNREESERILLKTMETYRWLRQELQL